MGQRRRFLTRTDIWREGKWLDLWSVVHFLSGVSLGFGAPFFGFGPTATILIGFLLLVGYEMWEAMVQIAETPQNRFMDVVVGMVSFVPAYFFTQTMPMSYRVFFFGLVLIVNIGMAVLGWLESRKAEQLEERLRQRFLERRQRRLERKARALALTQTPVPPEQTEVGGL